MRELFAEVLELQKLWSYQNTPAMARRGAIIRNELPRRLRSFETSIARAMGPSGSDLQIEGGDGTGSKSEVPWLRFGSESRSPDPTRGWYCAVLFHAGGKGVYLCLGHGSTRWENGSYKRRSHSELQKLISWARSTLAARLPQIDGLRFNIELGAKGALGEGYEHGNVASRWYKAQALPSEADFIADAIRFSELLAVLYDAEDLGRSPESATREADMAQLAILAQSDPSTALKRGKGQGFGLTAPERKAVEDQAMKEAARYLLGLGYETRDVSKTEPFDFEATKAGERWIVEVKGTTGHGESVLITHSERVAHERNHPLNALIVVHSIELDRRRAAPRASGGKVVAYMSWKILTDSLQPIAYQCVLTQV